MSEVKLGLEVLGKLLDLAADWQAGKITKEQLAAEIQKLPDPKPPKEKDDGA